MPPKVLAAVVNWNGTPHLQACLDSLAKLDYPRDKLTIVVIDNCSHDGSDRFVAFRYPHFALLKNTKNLGYAAAGNQAIRLSRDQGAEFVWLLNNDIVLAEDSLWKLIRAAQSDESIAVLSPSVYDDQAPDAIIFRGYRISFWTGRFRTVWPESRVEDVDSVQGCAALMRVSVFDSVGLFPPRFRAYFEEADLHVRVRKAGFRVVTVKDARVRHKKAASFDRVLFLKAYLLLRNLLLFEVRNARPLQLAVFFPYYVLVHLPLFVIRGYLAILGKIVRLPSR